MRRRTPTDTPTRTPRGRRATIYRPTSNPHIYYISFREGIGNPEPAWYPGTRSLAPGLPVRVTAETSLGFKWFIHLPQGGDVVLVDGSFNGDIIYPFDAALWPFVFDTDTPGFGEVMQVSPSPIHEEEYGATWNPHFHPTLPYIAGGGLWEWLTGVGIGLRIQHDPFYLDHVDEGFPIYNTTIANWWHPTGNWLATFGNWDEPWGAIYPFDAGTLTFGSAILVPDLVPDGGLNFPQTFQWSRSGDALTMSGIVGDSILNWRTWSWDNGFIARLNDPPAPYDTEYSGDAIAFHPDGTKVAVVLDKTNETGKIGIFAWDDATGFGPLLSSTPGQSKWAEWSKDGNWLLGGLPTGVIYDLSERFDLAAYPVDSNGIIGASVSAGLLQDTNDFNDDLTFVRGINSHDTFVLSPDDSTIAFIAYAINGDQFRTYVGMIKWNPSSGGFGAHSTMLVGLPTGISFEP